MEISRELLFFFSSLGAFNGIIFSLYFLFWVQPKHISNRFLGGLLLTLSVRIGKSVFLYFNGGLAEIYIHIGLSSCFFIGPFLYFYTTSVLKPESNISKTWKYHLTFMFVLIMTVGYLYPYGANFDLWQDHLISLIYYQWLIYIILAGLSFKGVIQKLWNKSGHLTKLEGWVVSIYLGSVAVWIAYMTCSYFSYIAGSLTFSFMLYLLILTLVMNKKKENIFFANNTKYGDKKIEPSEANELLMKLQDLMQEEKLYKNPDLLLPEVAKKLNIITHRLSQLINDNMGKTFPLFVNEYRIEEAKGLLKSNRTFTLEAIGYECGFNSKSTFYSTFKKHTGTTPAKYQNGLS